MIEKESVTFDKFNNITGINANKFSFNNNIYSINASILGEYPDDNFILEKTLYFQQGKLFTSKKNFYYGTFILIVNNERLFFTFDKIEDNKLIWKYIGSINDPQGFSTEYRFRKIVVIND